MVSEIGLGMTVATQPPVIWMLDPMIEEAEMVWTVDQGEPAGGTVTYYDCPRDHLWSPHLDSAFAYLADGAALGGVWKVDLGRGEAIQLIHDPSYVLVDWALEGLVTQSFSSFDRLILWDEDGNIVGEIAFAGE